MVVLVKDSCIESLESDLMVCFVLKHHHQQCSPFWHERGENRLSYFSELHMEITEEILDKVGVLAF